MANESQFRSRGGGAEQYTKLLNSIALDLDCMLNDLCESPPEVDGKLKSLATNSHLSSSERLRSYHSALRSNHDRPASNHSATSSLPHIPPTTSSFTSALLQDQTRPNTVPRGRDGSEKQRVRRSEEQEKSSLRSNDGKNKTVIIKTNPSGGAVQAWGGGLGQGEGELFDKVPGVDGYQNDLERLQTGSKSAEKEKDEGGSDYGHPCNMSLLERLIVTHSVWLLRGIYRTGAVHLLQGKEEGNFIIRQSSREDTMAITVRLPPDKGPYIEHYLIEAVDGKLRLEGSEYLFPAIPMLVSHYCQCCDELPVCLKLPRAVINATTKQELSALALLGQDFWMSSLANTHLKTSPSKTKPALPLPDATVAINNVPTRPSFSSFAPVPSSSSSLPSSPSSVSSSSTSPKKVAPPPPPRRSLSSPNDSTFRAASTEVSTNFTVTTTVTFHVNRNGAVDADDSLKVDTENEINVLPSLSPTLISTSPIPSENAEWCEVLSPLESPQGYHRSSLADKISDYEDIWVSKQSPEETSNQTDLEKTLARFSLQGIGRNSAGELKNLTKNHRHSDPNLACTSVTAPSPKSSCNSEPETLNKSAQEVLVLGSGGIINNGFQSSSSQLLSENNSEGRSTLPRTNDKRKSEFLKVIQDLMVDQSLSPTATLKGVPTNNKSFNQNSWPLDFSWEFRSRNGSGDLSDSSTSCSFVDHDDFLTEDEEVALVELRNKPANPRSPFRVFTASNKTQLVVETSTETVEQLLTEKLPQLKVPEIRPLTHSNLLRVSEYDNLGSSGTEDDGSEVQFLPTSFTSMPYDDSSPSVNRLTNGGDNGGGAAAAVELRLRNVPSEAGSSMTEFSEPWDSHRWETILMQAAALNRITQSSEKVSNSVNGHCHEHEVTEKDEDDEDLLSVSSVADTSEELRRTVKIPVLPCLLSLRRKDRRQGKPIRNYVFKMAQDKDLVFGRHIENFIACTLESNETSPHIVMRNIRQFMSGMANFLVNSGEGRFSELVQEQRAKLKPNEFLNMDAILEGVLHRIVVKPLKQHIYQLFVKAYSANGAVAMLSDSIKYARSKTPEQLGLKPNLKPPKANTMEKIKYYFTKLQKAYSPLKKLENLLAAISFIYQSILQDREGEHHSVGADDFLPLLLYVLVHCGLIAAEVEAEYMWGLLHPSLLSGEGGYYLTALSSAVHVLKNLHRNQDADRSPCKQTLTPDSRNMALCLGELDGFMKVLIPNELNGSIISKTVPVRPNMTSKDICRMVAHRLSVTNPQDYGLFKLVNGEEVLLSDNSYPWMVRMELVGVGFEVIFAYKRVDAKMAWPVSLKKA